MKTSINLPPPVQYNMTSPMLVPATNDLVNGHSGAHHPSLPHENGPLIYPTGPSVRPSLNQGRPMRPPGTYPQVFPPHNLGMGSPNSIGQSHQQGAVSYAHMPSSMSNAQPAPTINCTPPMGNKGIVNLFSF